jgi:hypothetical protein
MKGDDIISTLLSDTQVYIHYTDEGGLDRILSEGVIRTDQKGYVYFTQEPLTQSEAHNNLFIGASTHAGRGTHILVLRLDMGMPVEQCGYMELRVRQSVRLDQHFVIYKGENPFE